MAGQSSRSLGDPERQPLLPNRRDPEDAPEDARGDAPASATRAKRAAAWFARHAVPLFIGLLSIGVVVILLGFVNQSQGTKPSASETCLSPACVHASSEILYNLSPNYKNIDPCTDFGQLVCGGWDDRHDLRPDQGEIFTGTVMAEDVQVLLRHILEAPYPGESTHSVFSPAQLIEPLSSVDKSNFNKLKAAYDSCMDEDAIKKNGIKPLLKILHAVAASFPVSGTAFPRGTSFNAVDAKEVGATIELLARLGVSGLLSLGALADDKDPDVVVVQAVPPYQIGLPAKDYYEDESVLQKYEATITQILHDVHPARKDGDPRLHAKWIEFTHLRQYAHELVEFEKKLAKASPNPDARDDVHKFYNPMSLKDADLLTPQINLAATIEKLAPLETKVDRLIVRSPEYMKALSAILSDTPKEVLQTYFMWKVIQEYAPAVDTVELKPYSKFKNQLQGKDPNSVPERWRTCVGHVDSGLGFLLSRFFVERAFSAKAKDFGNQIVSDIKEMFIEKLKVTEWMDDEVVGLAIDKVHKIEQKIGYPTKSPNIMDPPSLRDYYNSVNVTSAFFDTMLSVKAFDASREWSSLGKPVDRDEWLMTAPTVNAYYNPPGNEIVFPAGIMQFPVFNVAIPPYVSYGAFGSISGHELSHAFDSLGRYYDQKGSYTDWWTNGTVERFVDRADCFIGQYHNFTIPGPDGAPIHVNGKLTQSENIADAGGVSAAFAAWKKRRAESPNMDLPGLDFFTQEQLFFVSYANFWCSKSRKEAAISRIYTDAHAPAWARILGTLANSRDFIESFNCPVKEPVCELW